jgi:hypothetical protein
MLGALSTSRERSPVACTRSCRTELQRQPGDGGRFCRYRNSSHNVDTAPVALCAIRETLIRCFNHWTTQRRAFPQTPDVFTKHSAVIIFRRRELLLHGHATCLLSTQFSGDRLFRHRVVYGRRLFHRRRRSHCRSPAYMPLCKNRTAGIV